MLSIWFFVGLILFAMGILITATGVGYLFNPQEQTVLAHLNPNLWWGGFMTLAGAVFLVLSYIDYKQTPGN